MVQGLEVAVDAVLAARQAENFKKVFTTSDFTFGGDKGRKFVDWFVNEAIQTQKLLPLVRTEVMGQEKAKIPCAYFGGIMLQSQTQNTQITYGSGVQTRDIHIDLTDLAIAWSSTWKAKRESAFEKWEDMIRQGIMQTWASNVELLAINGDPTTYAGATTNPGLLLANNAGWDVLTNGSILLSHGGGRVNRTILQRAVRVMPKVMEQNFSALRWICHPTVACDMRALISARQTAWGDSVGQTGEVPRLEGIPILEVPNIPIDKDVATTGETAGEYHCSLEETQYQLTAGVNNIIELNVNEDNAGGMTGNVVGTLTAGSYTPPALCAHIEAVLNAADGSTYFTGCATIDKNLRIILKSPRAGANSEIRILNTGDSAIKTAFYTMIGMKDIPTAAVPVIKTGAASGTPSTTNDGTFIWLVAPKQFGFAIDQEMRGSREYKQDWDRNDSVIRQSIDMFVDQPTYVVKITDVRSPVD